MRAGAEIPTSTVRDAAQRLRSYATRLVPPASSHPQAGGGSGAADGGLSQFQVGLDPGVDPGEEGGDGRGDEWARD